MGIAKKDLDDLVYKWKKQEDDGHGLGVDLAVKMIAAQDPTSLIGKERLNSNFISSALAGILLTVSENDSYDIEDSILELAFDKYWGVLVKRRLAVFDNLHQHLMKLKTSAKNPVVWNDLDNCVWAEKCDDVKIICLELLSAMRDDNTYVFYKKDTGFLPSFHARTVWPKETKNCIGGVEHPSINTYRKARWKLKYGDARDKGYCFSFDFKDTIDSSLAFHKDIYWALWHLDAIEEVLTCKEMNGTMGRDRKEIELLEVSK